MIAYRNWVEKEVQLDIFLIYDLCQKFLCIVINRETFYSFPFTSKFHYHELDKFRQIHPLILFKDTNPIKTIKVNWKYKRKTACMQMKMCSKQSKAWQRLINFVHGRCRFFLQHAASLRFSNNDFHYRKKVSNIKSQWLWMISTCARFSESWKLNRNRSQLILRSRTGLHGPPTLLECQGARSSFWSD